MTPYPNRVVAALFLTVVLSGTLAVAALAAAADLGSTFSGDGKITTRFRGGENFLGGVALHQASKFGVARYLE